MPPFVIKCENLNGHNSMLNKKRIAEQKRREKIRSDPVKAEELRRKDRERYHRKKAEGKIIALSEMPARARRLNQKRNKINFGNYCTRQKRKEELNKVHENENIVDRDISPSI